MKFRDDNGPPSGSDGEDNESWKYCLGTHFGKAMLLVWIIIAAVSGSVLSVAGAALILFLSEEVRKSLVSLLVSYATGTLLGAAFLGMLPHALEYVRPPALLGTVLAYIAIADLIPTLHQRVGIKVSISQCALLMSGIGTILIFQDG